VGGDVHQSNNRGIHPSFSDHGSAITMRDKNAWSIQLSQDAFRCSYILFKGCLRLLD
jgi:hypothetical protein